jgi:ribosomal protein L11 methyltransferase
MNYIEVKFEVKPAEPGYDILSADLENTAVESIVQEDDCLLAYFPENEFQEIEIRSLMIFDLPDFEVSFSTKTIEKQNWNINWESNFPVVEIDKKILVKAPFHQTVDADYDFVIEIMPKMSFGTGHHETTSSVLRLMLDMDFEKRSVMDMGCGTGILGIFAAMLGATEVWGIDIEDWAVENAIENAERNGVNMKLVLGEASALPKIKFDVFIANINRNILLADIPLYRTHMKKGAPLLLSGFYTYDLEDIKNCCQENGLSYVRHVVKNNWVAAEFLNIN